MPFSLYAATVPSYLQILSSVSRLIDKAESFCSEKGIAPESIIQARLAEDMLPFAYQVKSTAVHSLGAIEGVRRGVWVPDTAPAPDTFPTLKERIAGAIAALEVMTADEIDGFVGRDVRFAFGAHELEFTAENFLLSFSQPNFYFHASTAYDILRSRGVAIGKRNFLGKVRTKK